ncbi:MAG TPA: DUF177 domain-containing protein [Clostridium sp.]
MKIKLSDLISKKERKKEISLKFKIEPFTFEGDKVNPVSEVITEGSATADNDVVSIQIHIQCEVELICSRCLDTFIYPIDIDIEERFTSDSNLLIGEDNLTLVQDDVLDISEIVENSIISTLPIKKLCQAHCKGLCQSCGANLNRQSCNCNNENYDIRLEGLKSLLNNKEV